MPNMVEEWKDGYGVTWTRARKATDEQFEQLVQHLLDHGPEKGKRTIVGVLGDQLRIWPEGDIHSSKVFYAIPTPMNAHRGYTPRHLTDNQVMLLLNLFKFRSLCWDGGPPPGAGAPRLMHPIRDTYYAAQRKRPFIPLLHGNFLPQVPGHEVMPTYAELCENLYGPAECTFDDDESEIWDKILTTADTCSEVLNQNVKLEADLQRQRLIQEGRLLPRASDLHPAELLGESLRRLLSTIGNRARVAHLYGDFGNPAHARACLIVANNSWRHACDTVLAPDIYRAACPNEMLSVEHVRGIGDTQSLMELSGPPYVLSVALRVLRAEPKNAWAKKVREWGTFYRNLRAY